MLLTIFLAIVFCAAISLMLLSAVAFIQDIRFFSSAPKEAQEVLICYTDRAVDKHPKIWYNRNNQTRRGKSNEVQ